MSGIGFLFPKRWPTVGELAAHAARMLHVRAGAGAVTPTMLGTPTIRNQTTTQACGGFDLFQCANIWRQTQGLEPLDYSPRFPYWNARRYGVHRDQDVRDEGIDPDNMVLAAEDFGVCLEQDCPFTDDPVGINERPGAVAYQNGQALKIKLSPIFETGQWLVDAICHVISVERLPVFAAIEVVPAYDNATKTNGIVNDPSGPSRGAHAICAYGDEPDSSIWTAGSWGTGFGRNGSVLLKPEFAPRIVYAAGFEVIPE